MEVKFRACLMMESGKTFEEISSELGVEEGTLKRIKEQKEEIIYQCSLIPNLKAFSKLRPSAKFEMERVVFLWICHWNKRQTGFGYGEILDKANSVWKQMCDSRSVLNAEKSLGRSWMTQFLKMYNQSRKKLKGEKGSADVEAAIAYKNDLLERVQGSDDPFVKDRLFNLDETALYTKLSSSYTYSPIGIPTSGQKKYKDHITVLVGCNATGDCPLVPLILGKSKKPRDFGRSLLLHNTVHYKYSKSGWMTSKIFLDYVQNEFREEVKAYCQRKEISFQVELFIDNAPSHNLVKVAIIPGITVTMLPPNTTSLIQPMDQGIIWSFKSRYLDYVHTKLLSFLGANPLALPGEFWKTMKLRTVLRELLKSWVSITKDIRTHAWNALLDSNHVINSNQCDTTHHQSECLQIRNRLYEKFMAKNIETIDWGLFFNEDNIRVFMNELIDMDDSELIAILEKNEKTRNVKNSEVMSGSIEKEIMDLFASFEERESARIRSSFAKLKRQVKHLIADRLEKRRKTE